MKIINPVSVRCRFFVFVAALLFASLGAYFFNTKPAAATTLPVVYKSGTLSVNETWAAGNVYVVSSNLTIPNGITLTINAGTTVKYNFSTLKVNDGGTLTVNGTASDPVILTSYVDDTYGGDSNGNGSSTGAMGNFDTALTINGGTVHISHVLSLNSYYTDRITCSTTSSMTLEDSELRGATDIYHCSQGQVSMQRNNFNVESPYLSGINCAISLGGSSDPGGIILSGLNKNVFTGTAIDGNVIMLNGAKVESGSTWSTGVGGSVILMVNANGLSVNGTLNLASDTIVKMKLGGVSVQSGGTLTVAGTSGHPVNITSYKDDSIGGDTNADGPSTGSITDLDTPLYINAGSTVTMSYATVQNSVYSMRVTCNGSSDVTIADSVIKGITYVTSCSKDSLSMQRNSFDVASAHVDNLNFALSLCSTDPSNVVMTGSNKNTFTDTYAASNVVWLCGTAIPSGSTWTIDDTSGAVFLATARVYNSGTLNINSGAVIKTTPRTDGDAGIHNQTGGELNVGGTSSHPVVFTSYKDDSVGGDTNTDGSSSSPATGDYTAPLYLENDSEAALDYVKLEYGGYTTLVSGTSTAVFNHTVVDHTTYGINVGGGNVNFRGNFANVDNRAIMACAWDSNESCSVDAAYVDWGSVDGPFDSSNHANDLVCGMVTVSPWTYSSATYDASLYSARNCDGTTISGSDMPANAAYFDQRMGEKQIDCSGGFADACAAMSTATSCLNAAVGLASSTSPFPLPGSSISSTGAAFSAGTVSAANTYVQGLEYQTLSSFTTSALAGAAQVIGITSSLSSAYASCAP